MKALIEAKPELYWIAIGKDDFLYDSTINLRALYDEVGLDFIYLENEGRKPKKNNIDTSIIILFANGYDKQAHKRQLKALIEAKPELYWIAIGKDDFLYDSTINLRALYDEVGLDFIYLENEGVHDWNCWRMYLKEFAPMLFK